MTEAEFLFKLLTASSVIAGFLGMLYSAYAKLIAPIVERLQVIGSQMDKFSYTLSYLDKRIEPLAIDLQELEAKVVELEKTVEVLKVKIEGLKGGQH